MSFSSLAFVIYTICIFILGSLWMNGVVPGTKFHDKVVMKHSPVPEKYTMLVFTAISIAFVIALVALYTVAIKID